jgi:UDP-N-acetylglucosamine--N-acetylmuramyl-(pentapeptide) pyrophosphoryl-undecaprenol N-acetylglucosamine transferase|tara:strand:+ start:30595 stop:31683 length:1089 start_codon:yes stop_codon:yes gene_type:complete
MRSKRPIIIAAGGTGGHIFPGLALAKELKARSKDVIWLGTKKGLESKLVRDASIDIRCISVPRLRGFGYLSSVLSLFKLLFSITQTLLIFYRCRPSVVVGFGGFVSGPGGLAAWLMRKPLLIHEQNAIAGSSNRVLSKFASKIFTAFPNSFPRKVKCILIGNPIRESILNIKPPEKRFNERKNKEKIINVLILGGSQGAKALNKKIPLLLKKIKLYSNISVWHQVGKDKTHVESFYKDLKIKAKVEVFINNIAEAYSWADIVFCRSGALTISELEVVGVGAILIPLPNSIDNHQYKNAINFCSKGAGLIIPEDKIESKESQEKISSIFKNKNKLINFANRARINSKREATKILANACIDMTG